MAAAMAELTHQSQELIRSKYWARELVKGYHFTKGATLGEGDELDEEGHVRDEGEHEKGESRSGFSSSNRLSLHGFHQRPPLASKVQDAFIGLIWWNAWPFRSYCYFQDYDASSVGSGRDYVQDLPYYLQRTSMSMIQQDTSKYREFL